MAESGYNYYDTSTRPTIIYGTGGVGRTYYTGGSGNIASYLKEKRDEALRRIVWL